MIFPFDSTLVTSIKLHNILNDINFCNNEFKYDLNTHSYDWFVNIEFTYPFIDIINNYKSMHVNCLCFCGK